MAAGLVVFLQVEGYQTDRSPSGCICDGPREFEQNGKGRSVVVGSRRAGHRVEVSPHENEAATTLPREVEDQVLVVASAMAESVRSGLTIASELTTEIRFDLSVAL
jgi:hypothetical protein